MGAQRSVWQRRASNPGYLAPAPTLNHLPFLNECGQVLEGGALPQAYGEAGNHPKVGQ